MSSALTDTHLDLRRTLSSDEEERDDEAFRAEFRAWIAAHDPPRGIEIATTDEEAEILRGWQRTLHSGGWVGVHWPPEYGGRGASVTQIAIYNEELARANAPHILGKGGITLVGPTLMAHGTEEQRARWMPRILAGDDIWCQLFSEPDAGSDLAGLTTRGELRGDTWIVNGQKVWSSYAQFADWGIALVRTDPNARKHEGISMLAIPMDAPGIEIRPLRQMTGRSEFSEVFFSDVEVPADHVIGPLHDGWRVTNTTLASERGTSFQWKEQVRHEVAMDRLLATCAERGLGEDPLVRQRLAQAWIEVEILRLHNARTLTRLARGETLGPETSIVKLFWTGMSQRLHRTAAEILGPDAALVSGDPYAVDDGAWSDGLLFSRATSIMGGTSEIQRTVLGERMLGLPREPRPK